MENADALGQRDTFVGDPTKRFEPLGTDQVDQRTGRQRGDGVSQRGRRQDINDHRGCFKGMVG